MNNMYKAVGYMVSVAALGSVLSGPVHAGGLENQCGLVPSIEVLNKRQKGNETHYDYNVKILNPGDKDVTLKKARQCFDSKGCDTWNEKDRKVPAKGEYGGKSNWYTNLPINGMTLEYVTKDGCTIKVRIVHGTE